MAGERCTYLNRLQEHFSQARSNLIKTWRTGPLSITTSGTSICYYFKFNLFSEFYCFNNLALYTALSFFYNKLRFPTSQCRHCKSKFSTVLISRRILIKIFKKIYFWKDFSFYVAVVCANFHLPKYIMKD